MKATFQQVKDFFGTDARPVTNAELMDFQKKDPEGFTRLREEMAQFLAGTTSEEKGNDGK